MIPNTAMLLPFGAGHDALKRVRRLLASVAERAGKLHAACPWCRAAQTSD